MSITRGQILEELKPVLDEMFKTPRRYRLSKTDRAYLGEDKIVTLELAGLIHPEEDINAYSKEWLDMLWEKYLAGEI